MKKMPCPSLRENVQCRVRKLLLLLFEIFYSE